MNLLKTSSLALLISLCVFACKPDDEPKPNNSSNTGNNPSQNNPTNNQTNNGTNDTIYDPSDSSKVIGHTLPLSDSSELYIKITNGFDTTRTFHMIGSASVSDNIAGIPGASKELKPGESYVFHFNKEKNGLPWIIQFALKDEVSDKTQFVLSAKGVTWGNYYEFVVDTFLPYFD